MQVMIQNGANVKKSLPKVLKLNRIKYRDLSYDMAYSADMVSKWARGVTPLHFQDFVDMLDRVEQPSLLIFNYMNQTTHLIPPLADGPKFRKSPDTVTNQLFNEINEAVDSLNESMDEFMTDGQVKDLSDPEEAVKQVLDVQMLCETLEATLESRYNLPLQQIELQREKVWKMKGYLAKEA